MRLYITFFLSSVLFFSATGQNKNNTLKKSDLETGLYTQITTNRGNILLKLFPKKAPLTVANFVGLAEGNLTVFDTIKITKPFYDDLTFHRVISKANGNKADFMIQGGDPKGDGTGGPGYEFWNETSPELTHIKGALSMANAGPNTNGSQFFITITPQHRLDGKYNVFGKVIAGQNVVDSTLQGDTMLRVTIIRKGKEYNKKHYNPTEIFKEEYQKLEIVYKKEKAKRDDRLAHAKSDSKEEYKKYFYNMIKKIEPNAKQTASGLVYVVRKKGEGTPPKKGDQVSLHYLGKLVLGGKFDSSYDRNKPLNFKYKVTNLIPGFNEGVGLATQGERIDLYIPYFLAYGTRGRPPIIPGYSDLIFQLKILKVVHIEE